MSATTEIPAFLADLDKVRAEMAGKGLAALKKIIRQGFVFIREELLKVSAALVEAESRGERIKPEDVDCDRWFVEMARLIGTGRLLVDVPMRFGGRGHTYDALKAMPPERQAELLEKADDEVEAELRKPAPVRRVRHAADNEPGRTNGSASHARRPAPPPAKLSPEDAVKAALEVIIKCSDPAAAAEGLLHRLPPIIRQTS